MLGLGEFSRAALSAGTEPQVDGATTMLADCAGMAPTPETARACPCGKGLPGGTLSAEFVALRLDLLRLLDGGAGTFLCRLVAAAANLVLDVSPALAGSASAYVTHSLLLLQGPTESPFPNG